MYYDSNAIVLISPTVHKYNTQNPVMMMINTKTSIASAAEREKKNSTTQKIQMIQKLNPHNSLRMDAMVVCVRFRPTSTGSEKKDRNHIKI